MATNTLRRVHKLDDLTVFKLFESISAVIGANDVDKRYVIAGIGFLPEQLNESELSGRYAFQTASLSWSPQQGKSLTLNFNRDVRDTGGNNRAPSADYDEFQLGLSPDANSYKADADLIVQIMKLIGEVDISPAITGIAPNADLLREMTRSFNAAQQQLLNKLTEAVTTAEETRSRIAKELEEKNIQRQQEHDEAVEALEQERKRLEQESHKATRRSLLTRMTDKSVRDRVREGQSAQASFARWLVVLIALGAAALAGYSAILSLGAIGSYFETQQSALETTSAANMSFMVVLLARLAISSVVAIGALFYAANWLKVINRSDEAAGRDVDRFTYDLLRASWATEAYLESRREYGEELPEELMNGLTRGLFSNDEVTERPSQEEQALRSLLGMSASAKVGNDGVEVVLNKKELRKLAKAVESDQAD